MFRRAGLLAAMLSLTLALCLAVDGCGGTKTEQAAERGEELAEGSETAEISAKPDRGGTLIVGVEADADALNPIAASTVGASDIYGNMFIYLCKITPDMESYTPYGATKP